MLCLYYIFFFYLCILWIHYYYFFFFFQAEDGIRDLTVTGVQTCALPISQGLGRARPGRSQRRDPPDALAHGLRLEAQGYHRRAGVEWRVARSLRRPARVAAGGAQSDHERGAGGGREPARASARDHRVHVVRRTGASARRGHRPRHSRRDRPERVYA